jgi:hypothetical protein
MNNPTDGAVIAPATKQVERKGMASAPMSRIYPQIRGGQCEFCGTLDNNVPGQYQYKLCPHWRGIDLRCSYCDASKNPDEIIGKSTLNIYDHPTSGELVVVCDSYECTKAHRARFARNTN